MGSIGEEPARRMAIYPEVVDELARDYPDELWVKIPRSSDLTQGWRDVTYKELSHAVNGFARWVDCLLYTSPSPRDGLLSRMPSSA